MEGEINMKGVKKLQNERKELFHNLFNGKIPKRVPIGATLPLEFCIQYAGLPLAKTQWTLEGVEQALDKACEVTSSDLYPFRFPRYPAHLEILESRAFVMSSKGFIQHPEVVGMKAEEYDEFIKNPYDCIVEKVLPRLYTALDTDPINRSFIMAKAFKAFYDYVEAYEEIGERLIENHGFHRIPKESFSIITTPFDFVTDFLRGFRGMAMDVKRCPEKIIEACEAILPIQVKRGIPLQPSKVGHTFIPLHMGTYLRDKDFEKLYWPTFSKLVHALTEAGQPVLIGCDNNWMRYLDHLYELPKNTRFCFEFGDPKLVKEKLGNKHIISGFYPLTYLQTATKEECIDKAKELIDILAPGGKYYFQFDKSPITLDSVNIENYAAVLKYVMENTRYSNPEKGVTEENINIDKIEESRLYKIESKYYQSYENYKSQSLNSSNGIHQIKKEKLKVYEDMIFHMIFMLM